LVLHIKMNAAAVVCHFLDALTKRDGCILCVRRRRQQIE